MPTPTSTTSTPTSNDDTAPGSVPASERRIGRYWVALAVTTGLFATAVVGSGFVRIPYFAFAPGNAFDTGALVEVGGGQPTFEADGEILFLTVRVRKVRLLEAAVDWVDRDVDLVPEQGVLQGRSEAENRAAQAAAMTGSERDAIAVALDRLGIPRTPSGTGAVVTQVGPDTPAATVLDVADVVVAVDGQPVATDDDLGALIGAHAPGDTVTLSIQSFDGTDREVAVVLAAREDDPSRGFLGVGSQTREFDPGAPFPIRIPTNGVGGPSAGLAFTLAIIDVLTDGDLTGGHRVAVTGTISRDGSVGAVGGVAQKSAVAIGAGAEAMLVPAGEEVEAQRLGYDIPVIGVATVDEALAALAELGGDPVPARPSS